MKEIKYYVMAFVNTHHAMAAESLLKKTTKITLIPTLREISAGCGISIKIEPEDIIVVKTKMCNEAFDPSAYKIYSINMENDECYISEEIK